MNQRLTNSGIATTRTAVNAAITSIVIVVVARATGIELEADDPLVVAAIPIGITLVHRISTVLTELWPPLGYILFGIPRAPSYPPPPPPAA